MLLDPHAPRPKVGDRRTDVGHSPSHPRLGVRGAGGASGDRYLPSAAALEDDLVALVLAQDLKTEDVLLEGPAGVQIRR